MSTLDLRALARALRGEVTAGGVNFPAPSHKRGDRSARLLIGPQFPDGFWIKSWAGDDELALRDYVRPLLGLEGKGHRRRPAPAADRRAVTAEPSDAEHQEAEAREEQERARKLALARHLWASRRPINGTAAEHYLRHARGYRGPFPTTLGYLPASGPHPHAMVAAFGMAAEPEPGVLAMADDAVRGIHLTKLNPDGSDKADGQAKIMIGRSSGFPIVVAPPNDLLGLAITEGIEDALSVHQATGLGAWAAGSAGRMPALADRIPAWIDCVTVCAHADPAGQAGALALADAMAARGIETILQGISL